MQAKGTAKTKDRECIRRKGKIDIILIENQSAKIDGNIFPKF